MIKRLKRRFTLVAVSVISLVLLLILVTVNGVSRNSNIRNADHALEQLAGSQEADIHFNTDNKDDQPPLDAFRIDKRPLDKEFKRSFTCITDSDMNIIFSNGSARDFLNDETELSLVEEAASQNTSSGFADEYRFLKIEEGDTVRYIFLDYSFEHSTEMNLLMISIGVYLGAVFLFWILVLIFLRPVMKPIEASLNKQRQFITDASHELKTPLTVIATNMQIIDMEGNSSEWTDNVSKQVERLKYLTDEMVNLARMDEVDITLPKEDFNFSDLVNDVVMGFEPAILAEEKTIEVKVADDVKVFGNYDALEKVVSVLMNNALKYSNSKGHIEIDLHKKSKKISFSVTNTTDFIEEGKHNELFERFYRGDASRNSETGGFGIGLAVATSTIEEHNGKIEAIGLSDKRLMIQISL